MFWCFSIQQNSGIFEKNQNSSENHDWFDSPTSISNNWTSIFFRDTSLVMVVGMTNLDLSTWPLLLAILGWKSPKTPKMNKLPIVQIWTCFQHKDQLRFSWEYENRLSLMLRLQWCHCLAHQKNLMCLLHCLNLCHKNVTQNVTNWYLCLV